MRVGVFHPGTQHSWQTARAFHEAGSLAWYATSIFSRPAQARTRLLARLPPRLAAPVMRELSRRSYTPLNDAKVIEYGGAEWLEIAARRLGLRRLSGHFNRIGNAAFERRVAALVRRSELTALVGYNSSALAAFEACPPGVLRILDQTIVHPDAQRATLSREYALHPEMFTHDPAAIDAGWIAHQRAEHAAADIILCGSEVCRDTMTAHGVPADKLRVIPYGFPDEWLSRPLPVQAEGAPLKLLFLGTLSARKGAYYLLEAMRAIPPEVARLTVIGRSDIPPATLARYRRHVTLLPQVPKDAVFDSIAAQDVLVLPTLFEGFSLGLAEAIGAGLAVIHSKASGHPDHGNGVRLDDVSVESVRAAILQLASDRDALARARRRSLAIRPGLAWSHHRRALVALAAGR